MRGLIEAHLDLDATEDRRFMASVRAAVWAGDKRFAEIAAPPEPAAGAAVDEDLLAASLAAWGYRLETET